MEIYGGLKWSASTLRKGAELGYNLAKELHYYRQDRAGGQLARSGIPRAAFQYGSAEYNALNQNHKAIVNRYLPWHTAYKDDLNDAGRARVNTRNRTRHRISELIDPMRPPRRIQLPYLRRIDPHYSHPFDPKRRVIYVEPMSGPESEGEAAWVTDNIVSRFHERLSDIRTNNGGEFPRLQAWYNENRDLVCRYVFNLEENNSKLMWQMRISQRKIYSMYRQYKKYLDHHILEMLTTGHDASAFKEGIGTILGKMMGEAIETEPLIGGRGPMTSPLWA